MYIHTYTHRGVSQETKEEVESFLFGIFFQDVFLNHLKIVTDGLIPFIFKASISETWLFKLSVQNIQ